LGGTPGKRTSRALARSWLYPKYQDFERALLRSAAAWFAAGNYLRHPKYPYCLARCDDRPKSVILSEVADLSKEERARRHAAGGGFPHLRRVQIGRAGVWRHSVFQRGEREGRNPARDPSACFFRELLFAREHQGTFVLVSDEQSPLSWSAFTEPGAASPRGLLPHLLTLLPEPSLRPGGADQRAAAPVGDRGGRTARGLGGEYWNKYGLEGASPT